MPVSEGPEGNQEDGAALPMVSQVKCERFPTEPLKVVHCLVQLFYSRFFYSLSYGRQTVFLCSLLCTDTLLVHGCHHFLQMKSLRAQNKARLVSRLSSFFPCFSGIAFIDGFCHNTVTAVLLVELILRECVSVLSHDGRRVAHALLKAPSDLFFKAHHVALEEIF